MRGLLVLLSIILVSQTAMAMTYSVGGRTFRQDKGWPLAIELPPPDMLSQPDTHIIEVRVDDEIEACAMPEVAGCEGDFHDWKSLTNLLRIELYLNEHDPGLARYLRAELKMMPHATVIAIPKQGPEDYIAFLRMHEVRHGWPHFWRHDAW